MKTFKWLFVASLALLAIAIATSLVSVAVSTDVNGGMNGFLPFIFVALPAAGLAILFSVINGTLYILHRMRGGAALNLGMAVFVYLFFLISVGVGSLTIFELAQEHSAEKNAIQKLLP